MESRCSNRTESENVLGAEWKRIYGLRDKSHNSLPIGKIHWEFVRVATDDRFIRSWNLLGANRHRLISPQISMEFVLNGMAPITQLSACVPSMRNDLIKKSFRLHHFEFSSLVIEKLKVKIMSHTHKTEKNNKKWGQIVSHVSYLHF